MRRELLALHQQRAQPVHAVRRRLAAADGEPAGQCLPDRPGAAAARVLRHADRALGAADEPEGLRHHGRQSGGYRGAGRDDAGAGGGGDLPSAGGVQARPAHGDAAARGTAPASETIRCHSFRPATATASPIRSTTSPIRGASRRRCCCCTPRWVRRSAGMPRCRRSAATTAWCAWTCAATASRRCRRRNRRSRWTGWCRTCANCWTISAAAPCTSSATPPAATWRRTWRWHRPSACAA